MACWTSNMLAWHTGSPEILGSPAPAPPRQPSYPVASLALALAHCAQQRQNNAHSERRRRVLGVGPHASAPTPMPAQAQAQAPDPALSAAAVCLRFFVNLGLFQPAVALSLLTTLVSTHLVLFFFSLFLQTATNCLGCCSLLSPLSLNSATPFTKRVPRPHPTASLRPRLRLISSDSADRPCYSETSTTLFAMSPTNRMVRLPAAAALFAFSNFFSFATASPLSFPQPTRTVEYHEFNVQPWPIATAGPEIELVRRQLNTVCGYIGGDPNLPATCSAGSHCVVDAGQGVIGCCPDSGSCSQGVYTGCVDSDSGPQLESNPNVFTCKGADRCYMNNYEGGYSQYGCGTATGLATTVVVTASGKSSIEMTTLSIPSQTNSASTKSTKKSTASNTRSSKTTETLTSETETKTKTSTETTTSNTSETQTATSTETEASSATGSSDSSSSSSASAPDTDGKDNGSKNTGAIIGGTISGVAALVALIVLGIWLWKRKKGNQGINGNKPGSDGNGNIQPLLAPPMREFDNGPAPPPPMPVARGGINMEDDRGLDERLEPYSTQQTSAYGFAPNSNIGMAVGGDPHMDLDEVPLTRDNRELDEFTQVYNTALGPIDEEDSRPNTAPLTPMGSYPGPRGGGGGPLWQQNRGPGWV